jgi:hypothetical protein
LMPVQKLDDFIMERRFITCQEETEQAPEAKARERADEWEEVEE